MQWIVDRKQMGRVAMIYLLQRFIRLFVEWRLVEASIAVINFLFLLGHFHFLFTRQIHTVRYEHDVVFVLVLPCFQLQIKMSFVQFRNIFADQVDDLPISHPRLVQTVARYSARLGYSQWPMPCPPRHRTAQRIFGGVSCRPSRSAPESCYCPRWCKSTETSPDCGPRTASCCLPAMHCCVSYGQITLTVAYLNHRRSAVVFQMSPDCWLQNQRSTVNLNGISKPLSQNTYRPIASTASCHCILHTILAISPHRFSPSLPSTDSVPSTFPNREKNPSEWCCPAPEMANSEWIKSIRCDTDHCTQTCMYCSSVNIFIFDFLVSCGARGTLNNDTSALSFFMASKAFSPGFDDDIVHFTRDCEMKNLQKKYSRNECNTFCLENNDPCTSCKCHNHLSCAYVRVLPDDTHLF